MQFNKMAKLKRLKGFSEFVKRLKHPRKNDSKKNPTKKQIRLKFEKTGEKLSEQKFFSEQKKFRTKKISERKKNFSNFTKKSENFRENLKKIVNSNILINFEKGKVNMKHMKSR